MTIKVLITAASIASTAMASLPYAIVDSGQEHCYDERGGIQPSAAGEPFYGQDAQYTFNSPDYKDNGDGTVSDLVTGLMWTRDPGEKKTFDQAVNGASKCRTGDYTDWRLPTVKELYSLILFNGINPDPNRYNADTLTPFIDEVFHFQYGDDSNGDRIIDSQFATSTLYTSTTMHGNKTMFGVNFADGRIKGYPAGAIGGRKEKRYYVLYVRENPEYGENAFKDNGDGTITDDATGLTWMKGDSGKGMDWPTALVYAERLEFAGHSDWRLPNAKELQSLVDYSRSPDTTQSAAIDPIFDATEIKNEGGNVDFGWYWSSSTHLRENAADAAIYIAFGRALGWMRDPRTGERELLDVHGAGAQRSDPKVGQAAQFPYGRGPQGDVIRIENLVRCVRGGTER